MYSYRLRSTRRGIIESKIQGETTPSNNLFSSSQVVQSSLSIAKIEKPIFLVFSWPSAPSFCCVLFADIDIAILHLHHRCFSSIDSAWPHIFRYIGAKSSNID